MTPIAPHPPLRRFYHHSERERFVSELFDGSAPWYDWAIAFLSFGSGNWYRRQVLARAGLRKGHRVLDVATGTGVVARAAASITGDSSSVIGLDPSIGMLVAGREKARFARLAVHLVPPTRRVYPSRQAAGNSELFQASPTPPEKG